MMRLMHDDACALIRGRRLDFPDLVDRRLLSPEHLATLRAQLQTGAPFPHLVQEGWFNPDLLELVAEEFDTEQVTWRRVAGRHEDTLRSCPEPELGPASQLYFSLVNAGWFVRMLDVITGVDDLVPDVRLYGGGLHETRPGGQFGIHLDFDRHLRTGLRNELVLITYLNKDWQPEWHGALELWDGHTGACVKRVEPVFGRTLLMRRLPTAYHGHPDPLSAPEGVSRRSIASYYYSNPHAVTDRDARRTSRFIFETGSDKLRRWAKNVTPPLIWDAVAGRIRR